MADNDLKSRIEQFVDSNRDAIVQTLSQLLQFKTVSGASDEAGTTLYTEETKKCLQYLEGESAKFGFTWRNHDNLCAVADHGINGSGFIGLPVHIDVVPPGDGWTHEPFSGDVDEDTIWGRGCQDDKGPVAQMLWAMQTVKSLGLCSRRGMRLIVGTAEECGDWADIKHYFNVEEPPEYSIVPDAIFPIINGEKGMMNLRLRATLPVDESPAVGGFRFGSAYSGERPNIVPPRAELTFIGDPSEQMRLQRELDRFLGQFPNAKAELKRAVKGHDELTIVFHGKSAHGSTPQEGHSAALDMLQFIMNSGFVSDDEADMATFLYECGSDHEGGRLGIASAHEFIGPTTVNLGILQWLGGDCQAVFNIRNTLGLSVADATEKVRSTAREFAEDLGIDAELNPDGKTMEPIWVDPKQYPEFIGTLQEAYATFTGREATLHAIGGTTYAKVFPRAVCFGPVDMKEEPELAHQVDERIRIDHLLRNVKIYAYAIAKLCGEG